MNTTEKRGYCTLCRSRCGTINMVSGDALVEVRPDPNHPTGKAMCLKGKAAPELVHSADRLLYPMRRTRPKSHDDPGWQRISWDEALAEVAARLTQARAHGGAESVAFAVTTPSGTPLSDSIDWIERFIRLYGSPNTCYATEICNWHKDHAHAFTFGRGMPTADYRQADLILLWGHNPTNTWLAQADAIGAGRAAGARLLVVDPRETALAAQADGWLRVRPGADAALAMAIANLLIEANAFDLDFVRRWTNGPLLVRADNGRLLRGGDVGLPEAADEVVWDTRAQRFRPSRGLRDDDFGHVALRGRFDANGIACRPAFDLYAQECARYPAAHAASLTWVPEADIRNAARLIAQAQRVAYHAWSGVAQQENATQAERAIACLYALTGSFDRAGGNRIYAKPPHRAVNGFDLLAPEQRRKALGLADRPLGPPSQGWITARDLYQAILEHKPYPVRTLVAFGTNPMLSQADVERGMAALRALDFYVHCDLFETPASRYADLLLPVNTPWEREGLRIGFEISPEAEQLVQLRQQMVPSRGESRSDNDIVFDLAVRLGMGDQFFGGSLEAGWNHMLAPSGLTVEALRRQPEGIRLPQANAERKYADQPRGASFGTPTGLVELYSERLLEHGYPALPGLSPASEASYLDADSDGPYPLALTSAKNGYYCHSQHRGLVSLRRKAPEPVLELAPTLAATHGIREGDRVRVITPVGGAGGFIARLRPNLHPRVVVGEFGWWQRCDALGRPELPVLGENASNYNALIGADDIDPISGSVPMRAYRCRIEPDTRVPVARQPWRGFRPFRVAALTAEAADVMAVRLEPLDGAGVADYQPGQHVTIRFDGVAGTPDLIRAYSLTGPVGNHDARGYTIAVRHAIGKTATGHPVEGLVSTHIHRKLAVGDTVSLQAPGGTFVMPLSTRRPLVLLAGGIGITPFMSLFESLVDCDTAPDMLLLYGNQSGAGHAFRARLRDLQRRLPTLAVVNFYDRPGPGDTSGEHYDVAGRIDLGHVPMEIMQRRPLFYMCGPEAMMSALTAALIARGVPRFDILKEVFRSPAPLPPVSNQRFAVRFARSGRTAVWTGGDGTLLGFSERLGIGLPSGCRVGQCESCAVPVLDGQVSHLHGSDPDDAGICLVCQAVPTSDLVLDA